MNEHTRESYESDPRLDALLDEALAPPPTPDDLAQRVLARTALRVTARRNPVVGRIGPRRIALAFALAAAVALCGMVLELWTSEQAVPPATHPVAEIEPDIDNVLDTALAQTLEQDVYEVAMELEDWQQAESTDGGAAALDSRIADLELQWDDWDHVGGEEPISF